MNESHLNDLLNIDLGLDGYKESSLLGNDCILTLIDIYTRKAIQYAYRDTKTYNPSSKHYDRAILVMKKYYSKVKT